MSFVRVSALFRPVARTGGAFARRSLSASYYAPSSAVARSFRAYSAEADPVKGLMNDLDHATGPEKEELLAELEGRKQFGDTYLSGPMGTLEKPVIVKSYFDSRYVGCVGGEGDAGHDLIWHELTNKKDLVCAECGQVFRLEKMED